MPSQRKTHPFRRYVANDRKPKIDRDMLVTLSQVNAACSIAGCYRATVSQIIDAIEHGNGRAVRVDRGELIGRLNDACLGGFLENNGRTYEFTAKGIDAAGVENKDIGWEYKTRKCKVRYICVPR